LPAAESEADSVAVALADAASDGTPEEDSDGELDAPADPDGLVLADAEAPGAAGTSLGPHLEK
jgi:hypothetical protein